MSFFKPQVSFSSNFASLYSVMKDNSSVLFSSNNIYFAQKEHIKMKIFETFQVLGSKFTKFPMSILKLQVNSPSNFALLFSVMKDNSSYFFSSNNVYFTQKECIKMKIFETFKCSGQNLSNSP